MHLPDNPEEFEGLHNIECWIGFVIGLLLFASVFIFEPPVGMSPEAWKCFGLTSLMATWWATEAIPIPATSFLPMIMIPALDLGTMSEALAPYANTTIYLFLGGFILGLAMEKWNLHRRIALNIINVVGYRGRYQIAGFMGATAFLSMWVSNSATAIMMMPIALSVITMVVDENDPNHKRFAVSLLLAIAYGASIGGMATLIGTAPNALLRAFLEDYYKVHIGFGQWMILGIPVSIAMLLVTWVWLCRKRFYLNSESSAKIIKEEIEKLGKWNLGEKYIAIVFTLTAISWVFEPILDDYIPFINDSFLAMFSALTLFVLPVNIRKREFVMDWGTTSNLPWGTLILFGGGLALAAVISSSGLADWISIMLSGIKDIPFIITTFIIVTIIIFLTEVTSNTATTAAFLPLLGALASTQGIPPQLFAIPATVAASCAFMMPVATPPNTVVFSTGKVPISAMMRAGLVLNIAGMFIVTAFCHFLVGIFE